MIKETSDDDLAESYLQQELMNETRAYIERGRIFEHSSDRDLKDIWVAAFERWFEKRTLETAQAMDCC